MTDGFDPIATSGTETYVITVDNVGTQDVTGIRVRDTLPAGTKFLSVVADATHSFTCSQDGSATGGTVECIGGKLLGTESEFYDPAGPPRPAGRRHCHHQDQGLRPPTDNTMHNEVRVDPLNEIPEYNELNNLDDPGHDRHQRRRCAERLQRIEYLEDADQPRSAGRGGYQRHSEIRADRHERCHRPRGQHPRSEDFLPRVPFHRGGGHRTRPGRLRLTYAAGVIDCRRSPGRADPRPSRGLDSGQTRKIDITVTLRPTRRGAATTRTSPSSIRTTPYRRATSSTTTRPS